MLARRLVQAPAFAWLVVLTLGLGIGATTAMFSVVDAVLLRPLRFPGADRAVEVWTRAAEGASAQPGVPGPVFASIRETLADLAAVEAYQFDSATFTGGTEPLVAAQPHVTPGLLHLVGATPVLGRVFTDDDARDASVVLISERTWTAQFGRDPAVIGRRLSIDGQAHTIVGVLSARSRYPEANAAAWKPLEVPGPGGPRRRVQALVVPRPGVEREEIGARLASLTRALREQGGLTAGQSLLVEDVVQARVARAQGRPLWLLLGAVSLVLLIACANAMNLFLVRAAALRADMAIRSAIGAGRGALLAHAAAEVVMLGLAGAVAGVALAAALIRLVPVIVPEPLTYLVSSPADLSWRVLLVACGLTALASLAAGVVPAWRASRVDALEALRWPSPRVAGTGDDRWQAVMVALQMGLVVVLLCGTGAVLRSLVALTQVDPGYDAERLLAVSVELGGTRYQDAAATRAALREIERTVEAAEMGDVTMTAGAPISFEIRPEGEGGLPVNATGMVLPWSPVAPDYFAVMGIPVLSGRVFDEGDGRDVIVINDRLARTFWGESSPIGRRFRLDADEPWRTVVGVVGDVRMMGLDDPTGHGMEFYTPLTRARANGSFTLVVRPTIPLRDSIARVKALIWTVDPDLPVTEATSMRAALLDSLYRQRFVLRLAAVFAGMAALLAGVGIYGVAACWVSQRRRDLAVRIALGAPARHVAWLVVSRTGATAAVGMLLGLAGVAAMAPVLQPLLFDARPADPLTALSTIAAAVVLVLTAGLPSVRRALASDPATALRQE